MKFPTSLWQFAYFIWPDLAQLTMENLSVRCFHHRRPSCHLKTATASLRRRFLCGCLRVVRTTTPFTETWETEARHGCFMFFPHIFVKFLKVCGTKSDFLLSGTPVGLLEIGGSPEPKWFNGKNNLSFQSFLHRSCLRVECHVVSVSFMSLRNCGACPLVAPANHDSGHRAIRCCIFEDGDDVDRKEVKQKTAFSF